MTISIEFSDGEGGRTDGVDVATNRGWSEFGEWAERLPVDQYEQVIQLWEYGATRTVQEFDEQLRRALKGKVPKNVRSVADNLLALCERNIEAEGIFVVDDS